MTDKPDKQLLSESEVVEIARHEARVELEKQLRETNRRLGDVR